MIDMSRSPLETRTRFIAPMTRRRTDWIGSGEVSPSPSGPRCRKTQVLCIPATLHPAVSSLFSSHPSDWNILAGLDMNTEALSDSPRYLRGGDIAMKFCVY